MASKIPLSFYLDCVDIYVMFSLKGKQFRRKEAPVCVEEDNCEESPEEGVSSCDEEGHPKTTLDVVEFSF